MKHIYNTATRKHLSSFWKAIRFYCCFVAFSAVFLFANFSGWAHVPEREQATTLNTSAASEATVFFNNHHADPHPFSTGLVFVETEVVDETQSGNEHDSPLAEVNIPAEVANYHTGKSLFQQLKLVNESREKISLFVLHHSWKSFLG